MSKLLACLSRCRLGAVLPLASSLVAQIPLGGSLSGTLAPAVYHATSTLSVPTGQTLTLPAGVIIKFSVGQAFNVDGTLVTQGTAGNPVIFTDIQDDSAGGDTNGNGPSSGSPGTWFGLLFASGASSSVLTRADVRYGGYGYYSNLHLSSASPTFVQCTSRDCLVSGMQLNGSSLPTVTNCAFANNGQFAIDGVPVEALANFSGNTAAGNGAGNYARVTQGSLGANLTLGPAAMISGAVVLDSNLTIPPGVALTLQAGLNLKFRNPRAVDIAGTLLANGTAANPIVFTDLADDSVGGDTNGNGPSTGSPGSWFGLLFASTSSASALQWTEARFGGYGYYGNFHLTDASPSFVHCTAHRGFQDGMALSGNCRPLLTDCVFTGNGRFAVEGVALPALAGFANNTAVGNGYNFARVTDGQVSANLTVGPAAMINGAVVLDVNLTVPTGVTLTLQAGLNLKYRSPRTVDVAGTLLANGTAGNPVVFTDLADDSVGGDTNGDGPSSGNPASWFGVIFQPTSSASALDWTEARYGGYGYYANFYLNDASPTLRSCTSRHNFQDGMWLSGNARPTVRDCVFVNNARYAVEGVALAAVPGFINNTATGNGGNFLRVTAGTVTGSLKIGPQSVLGGALVLASNIDVQTTGTLVVEQGVVCKFTGGLIVSVAGGLDLRGTSDEPVVFTDFADDAFGGDTNNNGLSTGGVGSWFGIEVQAGAMPARLTNARIRYAGYGYYPGLSVARPLAVVQAVRVDHAYDRGFALNGMVANAPNLVAYGCGGSGIHLIGGAFHLPHATVTACGTGVRMEAAWTGQVVNSICYGNGTNFANFGAGSQVRVSDGGFAGTNGNVNVDPQFVAAASGDLRLGAASPCLGLGDFYFGLLTQRDHDGNSRLLDHSLSGWPAPDLGAFERAVWGMTVAGTARPGQTVTFTVTGPAGESFVALGLAGNAAFYLPWGMLLASAGPGEVPMLLFPVTVPVGIPMPLPLANSNALLGARVGVQTLTFPVGNLAVGNFTRLHEMLVRP